MVLTAIDLDLYPQHAMPLEMFRDARPLDRDPQPVGIRSAECGPWRLDRFGQTCGAARAALAAVGDAPDAYELKSVLSALMLLPSQCLQARGARCTKRESFGRIGDLLDDTDRGTLDALSQARLAWHHRGGACRLVESALAAGPNPFGVSAVDHRLNRAAPCGVLERLGPDWREQATRYVATLASLAERS